MHRGKWTTASFWCGPLVAATLLAGCGGGGGPSAAAPADAGSGATTDPGTPGTSSNDDDFAFPEDADPEVAALSFVQDELLARIAPGAEPDDLAAAYAEAGAAVLKDLPEIQTTVLGVDPDELAAVAGELSANPLFEAVQRNYLYEPERTPDDPKFESQDYLELIGLSDAWEVTTGTADVVIAVLDTGVAKDHPDLSSKLLGGWNTFDDSGDTSDVLGHGTAVAGVVAAASDNGVGIAGTTWESPIIPVRVSNADGQASSRAIADGLIWAVNHGAKVLNVSFAPLAGDRTVLQAAQYARNRGGLVFVSVGNSGRESTAKSNKHAIFVGATNASNERASFSTYGPFVDLATPGTGIQATTRSGGYLSMNGTSFSSPMAAGVAALVWSVRPELRPVTVEEILAETAVDLGTPGRDDSFGAGLVDAAAAVEAAVEVVEREDTVAPEVEITKPEDGASVSSFTKVLVSATDNEDIADLVLSIDGEPFATDTAEPYRFVVNTRKLAKGSHTVTCLATDVAGNASTPTSIRIRVRDSASGSGDSAADNIDPAVLIDFPADGSTVVGSVGIQATATDNAGLARAEWLVNGATKHTATISGTRVVVSFVWDAASYAEGKYLIAVRVTDTASNQAVASVRLIRQ